MERGVDGTAQQGDRQDKESFESTGYGRKAQDRANPARARTIGKNSHSGRKLAMSTIIVNRPVVMPSPTAQQIRKYAAIHKIQCDFSEYEGKQAMFRHLSWCCKGMSEIELYNAIMAVEV